MDPTKCQDLSPPLPSYWEKKIGSLPWKPVKTFLQRLFHQPEVNDPEMVSSLALLTFPLICLYVICEQQGQEWNKILDWRLI